VILVNGQPGDCVMVTDRGLAYGDGLFETLAVRDGRALHWDRHMTRMAAGCERLGLPMPDPRQWRAEAQSAIGTQDCGALKLMLTRGAGPRGYRPPRGPATTRIVMGLPPVDRPDGLGETGVDVCICRTRLGRNPALAGVKHLNRLEQVMARGEWDDEYHEGIMLDTEDLVIEATMSNLFLIRDDTLCTPVLDQCGVAGITRARVMEAAHALGIPTREGRFRVRDLQEAEGLFLTNTLIDIWPVRRLADRSVPVSPMVGRLREALTRGEDGA
jgi:4-amino-4-deoxychorismate lyase